MKALGAALALGLGAMAGFSPQDVLDAEQPRYKRAPCPDRAKRRAKNRVARKARKANKE